MKKINKIFIGGPACSGKTSLLHLLDSEENLVNFNHDKIIKLYDELFKKQPYLIKDLVKNKKNVQIKSSNEKKNNFKFRNVKIKAI